VRSIGQNDKSRCLPSFQQLTLAAGVPVRFSFLRFPQVCRYGKITEVTSGQIDAIVDPSGHTYLLRWAQEQLRLSEMRLQAVRQSGRRDHGRAIKQNKRKMEPSHDIPLLRRRLSLRAMLYFFDFTACFAAAALFFFCALDLVLACFCEAFLFVAFGDLSPIDCQDHMQLGKARA